MRVFDLPRTAQRSGRMSASHVGHLDTYPGDDAGNSITAEQTLDHALEDTFPASDPLSSNRFN